MRLCASLLYHVPSTRFYRFMHFVIKYSKKKNTNYSHLVKKNMNYIHTKNSDFPRITAHIRIMKNVITRKISSYLAAWTRSRASALGDFTSLRSSKHSVAARKKNNRSSVIMCAMENAAEPIALAQFAKYLRHRHRGCNLRMETLSSRLKIENVGKTWETCWKKLWDISWGFIYQYLAVMSANALNSSFPPDIANFLQILTKVKIYIF